MRKLREFLRSIFNPSKIDTMGKYVAKQNDNGTIDLYQVTEATGMDFNPVNIVVIDDTSVDKSALVRSLANAQATVDDLTEKIQAVEAVQLAAAVTITPAEGNTGVAPATNGMSQQ